MILKYKSNGLKVLYLKLRTFLKMKSIYIFPVALVLIFLVSCKKDPPSVIRFDVKNKIYKGGCKGEECSEVIVDYIKFIGNAPVSEKINSQISEFIKNSLKFNIEDTTSVSTIALAAEDFLNSYHIDKEEFPEISPYFAEISVSNTYRSEELLCLEMKQYLYTGGAHGYGSIWFLNIDIDTGEEILSNDLLKNEEEFTNYAEKKFREKMEIPMDSSINSTGFWFENDTFYLPETLGFQDSNLIILYNPYDISSYASGMIEVSIPLEEVTPYLQLK